MIRRIDDGTVESIFRRESGRAVATLTRLFGDIDIAEEAVQEAFVTAMSRWREAGLPMNPGGWIVTTAKNKALDRIRREPIARRRHCCCTKARNEMPRTEAAWMTTACA